MAEIPCNEGGWIELLVSGGGGSGGNVIKGDFISILVSLIICVFEESTKAVGCWWICERVHALVLLLLLLIWSIGRRRWWVLGSNPCAISFFLMHEFQKFFTSLSVLPGKYLAIWAHLLPTILWTSMIVLSSCAEKEPLLRSGLR